LSSGGVSASAAHFASTAIAAGYCSAVVALAPADARHLVTTIELAWRSREKGNHPFGSVLVDAHGEVVLEAENSVVTQGNRTNHAELNLVRAASAQEEFDQLRTMTLYASTEPCAMCAGAIYWSGIGRVVYALSAERLAAIVDDASGESELALSCLDVFARGGRHIDVGGPHLIEGATAVHEGK
jgi:tRNA(Arg) A34 adenosine deaminase TadA